MRCEWVPEDKALYVAYHDDEWGVPEWDDHALFAKLVLDGAQAGLSWWSILQRRDGYYRAFDRFDPEKMAAYGPDKIATLLQDEGIIRNRQKVHAAVGNARAYLELRSAGLGFADHLWSFVGGRPMQPRWTRVGDLPASTPESVAMSKDLKARGFGFVGPTICYAFMQAVGMTNDHVVSCFRHDEVARLANSRTPT